MPFPDWFVSNWYSFVEAAGVIGGLAFTAVSFRTDMKARRIANLLQLTEQHREIWQELLRLPELSRVLDPAPDLKAKPITREEELFVELLILHLNAAYQAIQDGMFASPEALRQDTSRFISNPIPRAVWDELKVFQNDDFVAFIQSCKESEFESRRDNWG